VRVETITVPYRVIVPVPQELTDPCNMPSFPSGNALTYGDVVEYLVEVIGTVTECNTKLDKIRGLSVNE